VTAEFSPFCAICFTTAGVRLAPYMPRTRVMVCNDCDPILRQAMHERHTLLEIQAELAAVELAASENEQQDDQDEQDEDDQEEQEEQAVLLDARRLLIL
jgi:hypothetical protein